MPSSKVKKVVVFLIGIPAIFLIFAIFQHGGFFWATKKANISPTHFSGLHVTGNRLVNGAGDTVILHGVNRSGAEYSCINGDGFFDGPVDAASVQAIASWHTNAVRVPMNEDCWLNIHVTHTQYFGTNYQRAIVNYVNLLNRYGQYVILNLHYNGSGTTLATDQAPMPDRAHSVDFWKSVATTFKSNQNVIFDVFNEPYPDNNRDTPDAWQCVREGVTCPGVSYPSVGMQELVNAIRSTGARNILMIPGVHYTNGLSHWLEYKPNDSRFAHFFRQQMNCIPLLRTRKRCSSPMEGS